MRLVPGGSSPDSHHGCPSASKEKNHDFTIVCHGETLILFAKVKGQMIVARPNIDLGGKAGIRISGDVQ